MTAVAKLLEDREKEMKIVALLRKIELAKYRSGK